MAKLANVFGSKMLLFKLLTQVLHPSLDLSAETQLFN